MARKWTPASSNPEEFDRQFNAAVEAGRVAAETEPRALAASYDAKHGRVVVELRDGLTFAFPASRYPQLDALGAEALRQVRVTASGYGLHWEDADLHLAVPQLILELFGTYSARYTGREGGKSKSLAKSEAARRNALRGGRPATRTTARRGDGMMRVEARAGAKSRTVDVYVGGEYVIEPMNPAAKKNRGRTGQVMEFGDVKDSRVQFRLNDTGRVALVDPTDLLPLERGSFTA